MILLQNQTNSPDPSPIADPLDRRLAEGDATALEELFRTHGDRLLRYVTRYVRLREVAEDVVQDVFLKLWDRRAEIVLGESSLALLHTMARNRAFDHLRRRRLEERYGGAPSGPTEEEEALVPTVESEYEQDELQDAVDRAVDSLPRRQREVLILRWNEHLTYDEIALRLGIAERTVAVHVQRGVRHLRGSLADLFE